MLTNNSRSGSEGLITEGGSALMDIETLAVRLGVSVRFVRRLVAERRMPFLKIGKFIRFDPADVDAWIESRRVGPSS